MLLIRDSCVLMDRITDKCIRHLEKKNAHLNFILLFCNDQDILNMKQKIQLNINAYRHNILCSFFKRGRMLSLYFARSTS